MNNKYIKYSLLIISLLIFGTITILLLNGNIVKFDSYIFKHFVEGIRSNTLTNIFNFITFFSGVTFIIVTTLLILFLTKNRRFATYMTLNVLLCFLLNQGLKLLFARPRPIDINLITESGYSYPSGHSMMSMAFYGVLIYFINRSKLCNWKKYTLNILLSILVLLIGFSRIYLGVHYASDVIAGFSLSFAYLIIFTSYINKKTSV